VWGLIYHSIGGRCSCITIEITNTNRLRCSSKVNPSYNIINTSRVIDYVSNRYASRQNIKYSSSRLNIKHSMSHLCHLMSHPSLNGIYLMSHLYHSQSHLNHQHYSMSHLDITHLTSHQISPMGWLPLVGSLKLYVSFAEYHLFYRSLLRKKPTILRSLLVIATQYSMSLSHICYSTSRHSIAGVTCPIS